MEEPGAEKIVDKSKARWDRGWGEWLLYSPGFYLLKDGIELEVKRYRKSA